MDGAIFSGGEIVDTSLVVLREVDGETSSVDEGHATALLFSLGTSVNLVIRVGLPLELHQFDELKTLLHGPLDDSSVARDGHEGLNLALLGDPLDIPNDIIVLTVQVFALSDGAQVIGSNVVDHDVTVGVSGSYQMGLLLGELATSDTVVSFDDLLREVRVLQSPEAEHTWLEEFVVLARDIVLSVTNSNKFLVLHVDVHARDLSAVGGVKLEGEQFLHGNLSILEFLFSGLLLLFLFDLLRLLHGKHHALVFGVFIQIVFVIDVLGDLDRRVVLIRNLLLVISGLSEQTLNNSDSLKHAVGELHVNIFDVFDLSVVTYNLRANSLGRRLTHGSG